MPRRREQFIAARWLARTLLVRRLGGAPGDWVLTATSGEPPRIMGATAVPVHFSVSHSGDWVAVALAPVPLGLDLEASARARPVLGLARLVCSAVERAELEQLDAATQLQAFYRMWTLKEAWLKRQGSGIDFSRMRALQVLPSPADTANAWTLALPAAGLQLALSVEPRMLPLDPLPPELEMSAAQYWSLQAPA